MIGFYNYTVILTYMGMTFGLFGIANAFNGNIITSIIFLMLAAVCDMFDGIVARTKKRTKQEQRFGIQIDSLSDVICFGILPASIGYNLGMNKWCFVPILIYYVLAALIRLAYYNVLEEESQETSNKSLETCTGLPVPPSALIFPFVYLISTILKLKVSIIYAITMLIVATLFIKRFSVKKLNLKGSLIMIVIGLIVLSLLLIFK